MPRKAKLPKLTPLPRVVRVERSKTTVSYIIHGRRPQSGFALVERWDGVVICKALSPGGRERLIASDLMIARMMRTIMDTINSFPEDGKTYTVRFPKARRMAYPRLPDRDLAKDLVMAHTITRARRDTPEAMAAGAEGLAHLIRNGFEIATSEDLEAYKAMIGLAALEATEA